MTDTHVNTKQVRLPIRTHVRLALLAATQEFTVSTMADIAVEEWLAAHGRHDLLSVTDDFPKPKRRLPSTPSGWNILDEEHPPSTRQVRLPIRTHYRLKRLAAERRVFIATVLEDIMNEHAKRVGVHAEISVKTDHLPAPARPVPRVPKGEIAGPPDAKAVVKPAKKADNVTVQTGERSDFES